MILPYEIRSNNVSLMETFIRGCKLKLPTDSAPHMLGWRFRYSIHTTDTYANAIDYTRH